MADEENTQDVVNVEEVVEKVEEVVAPVVKPKKVKTVVAPKGVGANVAANSAPNKGNVAPN